MSEHLAFLRAFARDRKGVGAVAPSSPHLARALVGAAGIRPGEVVVELGAGTGPMTRELVARHPDARLLVLEPDPHLAAQCRERAPGVEVVEAYAQELPALLAARGHAHAHRVVSSLPFAGWDAALQEAVFDAIGAVLVPGGRFVTFTYAMSPWLPAGRRARSMLARRFARVDTTPIVWRNTPPAFVYVCDAREAPPVGTAAPTR